MVGVVGGGSTSQWDAQVEVTTTMAPASCRHLLLGSQHPSGLKRVTGEGKTDNEQQDPTCTSLSGFLHPPIKLCQAPSNGWHFTDIWKGSPKSIMLQKPQAFLSKRLWGGQESIAAFAGICSRLFVMLLWHSYNREAGSQTCSSPPDLSELNLPSTALGAERQQSHEGAPRAVFNAFWRSVLGVQLGERIG